MVLELAASQLVLMAAWGKRGRQQRANPEEVIAKRAKNLQGADSPHSEEVVTGLLNDSGFETPLRFFSSLFWSAPGSRAAPAPEGTQPRR